MSAAMRQTPPRASRPPRQYGTVREAESMARHTVWGIGGVADRFYAPVDVEDLARFVTELPEDEPVLMLGLGSNLLVRDGGFRGTVISTGHALAAILQIDGSTVRVQAGVACPKVARYSVRHGLAGCEFFAGIPGTVGGALAMNAGAFGGETWTIVRSVETLDRQGEIRRRAPADFEVAYRQVKGPVDEWFLAADLSLEADPRGLAGGRLKELLRARAESQPMGRRSCGSVFRNPPDDFAARLIQASGLKGARVGGAMVSEKHANFIINTGDATAADVETLMARVVEQVASDSQVHLQREVHIVGEHGR